MTEADKDVHREKLLEFLNSKEPAWKDEDHPELKDGAGEWCGSYVAATPDQHRLG